MPVLDTCQPHYTAIGQYLIYRDLINKMEVIRPLYLAIPTTAYEGIFKEMAMGVIVTNQIKLIVVNLDLE
jgi:glucose-6-phosphate 1-dehydrogenase